jgi:hypothetical protein
MTYRSNSPTELPRSLERRLKLIETLARHTAQEDRAPAANKGAPHAPSHRHGPTIRETYPELAALWQWLILKYSPDQPRVPAGSTGGGQWTGESSASGSDIRASSSKREAAHTGSQPKVPNIQIAAGLRCDGFSSGCQSGGTYGTTGRYNINGRVLCTDCAIKFFGLQDEPQSERDRVLRPFVIGK